jgi:hypothetical protein
MEVKRHGNLRMTALGEMSLLCQQRDLTTALSTTFRSVCRRDFTRSQLMTHVAMVFAVDLVLDGTVSIGAVRELFTLMVIFFTAPHIPLVKVYRRALRRALRRAFRFRLARALRRPKRHLLVPPRRIALIRLRCHLRVLPRRIALSRPKIRLPVPARPSYLPVRLPIRLLRHQPRSFARTMSTSSN